MLATAWRRGVPGSRAIATLSANPIVEVGRSADRAPAPGPCACQRLRRESDRTIVTSASDPYDLWNQALIEAFFPVGVDGKPVYLAVDGDELSEIASTVGVEPDEAEDSLAGAVQVRTMRGASLARFRRSADGWRDKAEVPPYVATLGLFVLAASRMASDAARGIWANDYYSQLNCLLGRDPAAESPPDFDSMYLLWKDLASWLDDDCAGERGRATIRTHVQFRHIGYPISQCVLRAVDRRRLPDFFRAVGLSPGRQVSGQRLRTLFRAWARPGSGISEAGRAMARADGAGAQEGVEEILLRELASWDGELRDARGRRRSEILLWVGSFMGGRRIEIATFARRPAGFPADGFRDAGDRPFGTRLAGDEWYSLPSLEVTSQLLERGARFTVGDCALTLEPRDLVPLDEVFVPESGWLATPRATAFRRHWVLYRGHLEAELARFLRAHAAEGWKLSEPSGVPAGWKLAKNVQITNPPTIAPPGLEALVPQIHVALSLVGGLRVSSKMYLVGGEPDIQLSVEAGDHPVVELDGRVEQVSTGLVTLPLSGMQLAEGEHSLTAAGERRSFSTIRTFGEAVPHDAGALAHEVERHSVYHPTSAEAIDVSVGEPRKGHVRVAGASIQGDASDLPLAAIPPVILLHGFFRCDLFGPVAGDWYRVSGAPSRPSWLNKMPGRLGYQYFEVDDELAFPPEFVAYTGAEGIKVRAISHEVAAPRRAGPDLQTTDELAWATALMRIDARAPDVDAIVASQWRAYVDLAELIRRSVA